jgi:hypothetical protein
VSPFSGADLLHGIAERIVAAHVMAGGAQRAEIMRNQMPLGGRGVDIQIINGHGSRKLKVKADPYYGTDPIKIADRRLPFYRGDVRSFAFESVANSATGELGWTLASEAQDLYYYYFTIAQTAEEVRALTSERDEVLFSELAVERDELIVLPMPQVRAWFAQHNAEYAARPVMVDGIASWCRLIPQSEVAKVIPEMRRVGPIFGALAR